MGHISKRNRHRELGALAENTLDIDRAVVLQDNTLGDGKAKARSADFSRSGFVDPVESLVDLVEGILRDSDAGVLDTDVKVVGIRVDGHSDFAVIPVVFDRIFDQVCNHHDHLDLVDLGVDLSHADHRQLDVSFLRDRPEPVQDQLYHFVYAALLDVELGVLSVHAHQGEQLCDDLVFAVDFVFNIDHEFPVHLDRYIFLLHERVRQDFHRSHGRLELVGDVGNEFLPRLVESVHSCEHLIKGIRDMFRLNKRGRLDGVGRISRLYCGDLHGKLLERFHQNSGQN